MFRPMILAALVSTFALTALAVAPINKSATDGVAIRGYDPVAYFTDGKAVKGAEKFEYKWMDATWRFATAAHRAAFAKEPARYMPQYGGYCAFGVSEGHAAPVDPLAWMIVGGKLYLNYNQNVQKLWVKQIPERVRRADENWPGVLGR